jgi:hypothetical protein
MSSISAPASLAATVGLRILESTGTDSGALVYAEAVRLALSPLRKATGEALESSATFPISKRYPPTESIQTAPAPYESSINSSAAFFEGQDFAAMACLRGDISAGQILSGLVGSWHFFSAYDELYASPAAEETRRNIGGSVEDCLVVEDAGTQLCGSHEARLTLRPDGTFTTFASHIALGPGAGHRSINLSTEGRWAYLLGEQRLALASIDSSFRVRVRGLTLKQDGEKLTLTLSKGSDEVSTEGPKSGRKWISLEYDLIRDEDAFIDDARDEFDSIDGGL